MSTDERPEAPSGKLTGLHEAFKVILELAEQNILDEAQANADGMEDERKRQQEAVTLVEDYYVNHVAEEVGPDPYQ